MRWHVIEDFRYTIHKYQQPDDVNYYVRESKPKDQELSDRLPSQLLISNPEILTNNGREILLVESIKKDKRNKHIFQTILLQTNHHNWYLGHHQTLYKKEKWTSILIFRFGEFNESITIYDFFDHDEDKSDDRMEFCNYMIWRFVLREQEF